MSTTITSTTPTSSDYMIKPLASAGFTVAIDQLVLGETDINKSVLFGVSSGIGVYAGMMVGSYLPDLSAELPTFLGNGKGLLQRVAEVGFGGGAAFAINKYMMKNLSYRENMTNKIATLVVADIAGEYVSDYIAGRPLSFLQ